MWSWLTIYAAPAIGGAVGAIASIATIWEGIRRSRRAKRRRAMEALELWRAADEMVRLFGREAEATAMSRAYASLEEGNAQDFQFWRRMTLAIRDLERRSIG
ncbi:MAG TPA: hypothetical protein VGG48_04445 [Rhizomicrobium sp.]|jgi:hypothetical protein